ncbi:helix-turn-helix transcriptional regulator [Aureimonas sp. SK2]|uniref:helix-turn-helix domain-containing protein n=1 Tax=Aureimonas sp. SK2 TaxID=3015992 RepID=UPI002444A0D8|nr:helix-turn-helix transcriptional regulator [Aureimonas sp. SK2]
MMAEGIEVHLGKRVLERRQELSWSQNGLAKELGISTPQLRKYEAGANRIGAETLYKLAILLDVEVGYFYEGLPGVEARGSIRKGQWSIVKHAESLEAISDAEVRKILLALIDRATPPTMNAEREGGRRAENP